MYRIYLFVKKLFEKLIERLPEKKPNYGETLLGFNKPPMSNPPTSRHLMGEPTNKHPKREVFVLPLIDLSLNFKQENRIYEFVKMTPIKISKAAFMYLEITYPGKFRKTNEDDYFIQMKNQLVNNEDIQTIIDTLSKSVTAENVNTVGEPGSGSNITEDDISIIKAMISSNF